MWAPAEGLGLVQFHIVYTALSNYRGAMLAIGVIFNVALLKYVKQKTKNSSVQQALDSGLKKTVMLILASLVSAFLPLMITLALICRIYASICYASICDRTLIKVTNYAIFFTSVPPQVNAVLNSVIYFARSTRIKRYYHNLFNRGNERRHLAEPRFSAANRNRGCQQQQLNSVSKSKHETRVFSVDIRLFGECSNG